LRYDSTTAAFVAVILLPTGRLADFAVASLRPHVPFAQTLTAVVTQILWFVRLAAVLVATVRFELGSSRFVAQRLARHLVPNFGQSFDSRSDRSSAVAVTDPADWIGFALVVQQAARLNLSFAELQSNQDDAPTPLRRHFLPHRSAAIALNYCLDCKSLQRYQAERNQPMLDHSFQPDNW